MLKYLISGVALLAIIAVYYIFREQDIQDDELDIFN